METRMQMRTTYCVCLWNCCWRYWNAAKSSSLPARHYTERRFWDAYRTKRLQSGATLRSKCSSEYVNHERDNSPEFFHINVFRIKRSVDTNWGKFKISLMVWIRECSVRIIGASIGMPRQIRFLFRMKESSPMGHFPFAKRRTWVSLKRFEISTRVLVIHVCEVHVSQYTSRSTRRELHVTNFTSQSTCRDIHVTKYTSQEIHVVRRTRLMKHGESPFESCSFVSCFDALIFRY